MSLEVAGQVIIDCGVSIDGRKHSNSIFRDTSCYHDHSADSTTVKVLILDLECCISMVVLRDKVGRKLEHGGYSVITVTNTSKKG